MTSKKEKEVYEALTEVETTADVLEAVEPLNGDERTPESEVIINAAGYLVGKGLYHESKKNK